MRWQPQRLEVQNPTGHWDPKQRAPATELWNFARRQFGNGEVVLLGVRTPPEDTVGLEATRAFEEWVAAQPEVATSFVPANVRGFEQSLGMRLRLGRQLGELRNAVFNRDRGVALLYVTLHPPPAPGSLELKVAFLDRLGREGIERLPEGADLIVAGKPVADVALNQLVRESTLSSAPIAFAAMALVLVLVFRRRTVGPFAGATAACWYWVGLPRSARSQRRPSLPSPSPWS